MCLVMLANFIRKRRQRSKRVSWKEQRERSMISKLGIIMNYRKII